MNENKERETNQEPKKRVRKVYKKGAGTSQTMVSFRCDNDVKRLLDGVRNKGRLINDLIRAWAHKQPYEGDEISPDEWDLDYYQS